MPAASTSGGHGPRRTFFDLWSRVYDLPPVQAAVYRPVHHAVMAELASAPPRAVLDVGCGTGILTRRVRRELGATLVAGCDFSYGMLEQARVGSRQVAWVQGDALRLPLRDGAVDAALSTESFHWFPDHAAALAELRRVLVPGGRLLVALIAPRARATGRVAAAGSRLAGEPAHWPTRGELLHLLQAAGFEVVRQRRILRVSGMLLPTVLTVAVAR